MGLGQGWGWGRHGVEIKFRAERRMGLREEKGNKDRSEVGVGLGRGWG